jgi:small-conductance mechanosensitive channel
MGDREWVKSREREKERETERVRERERERERERRKRKRKRKIKRKRKRETLILTPMILWAMIDMMIGWYYTYVFLLKKSEHTIYFFLCAFFIYFRILVKQQDKQLEHLYILNNNYNTYINNIYNNNIIKTII